MFKCITIQTNESGSQHSESLLVQCEEKIGHCEKGMLDLTLATTRHASVKSS